MVNNGTGHKHVSTLFIWHCLLFTYIITNEYIFSKLKIEILNLERRQEISVVSKVSL